MNHLVVPTDFSDNAHNALSYAIGIADHFETCTIHLIHVYQVSGGTGTMESVTDFIETRVRKAMSNLVGKSKGKLSDNTNLIARSIEGSPVGIIAAYAERLAANYIVMGTHGASGLKGIFMGSNTVGVIKSSNIPVLAIPAECKYQVFKKFVFAIDTDTISNSDVVEPLVQLAKKYNSLVKVLQVGRHKSKAAIDAGVDIYLADLKHTFHFVEDVKIDNGIDRFVKEEKADLLCMIRRERDFFSDLFHISLTRQEAFDSKIPLLILHDK